MRGHEGADGVGVRRDACELHQQPVAALGKLVVQHLGTSVEIVDHQIETAVVVEIAHGQTPAHALVHHHAAVLIRHFVECTVAAVVI